MNEIVPNENVWSYGSIIIFPIVCVLFTHPTFKFLFIADYLLNICISETGKVKSQTDDYVFTRAIL